MVVPLRQKKKIIYPKFFSFFFFYDRLSPMNQGIDRLAIYQNKAHVQLYQIIKKNLSLPIDSNSEIYQILANHV